MTGLLLLKEHLKEFYNKYSYWIRFVVRLLLVLCTVLSMNANIKKSSGCAVALRFWCTAPG